jgi:hypothetical protein
VEISDEDKGAFMMAVHGMDRQLGLDLILHTPGGSLAATESIMHYLHEMFGVNIRTIIPQIAMSAGTMMACSSRLIIMGKHSNVGPIDPHLRSISAQMVLGEFEQAWKEVQKDPGKAALWQPIISKYHPTFLTQCKNAVDWARAFTERNLRTVMFAGDADAAKKAADIVESLISFGTQNLHDRHLHIHDCLGMGLKVEALENVAGPEFQDTILTVHHSYLLALANTAAIKMIENHTGRAFVKQAQAQVQMMPMQMQQLIQGPPLAEIPGTVAT